MAGTTANISPVRSGEVQRRKPTPPSTWAKLRRPIEMLALTALCSTVVSDDRRLVNSPVRRSSKKAISWSRMPLKSRSRMRATARSPAIENSMARLAMATPCTSAARTISSAALSTSPTFPPPRTPSMMTRMPCG